MIDAAIAITHKFWFPTAANTGARGIDGGFSVSRLTCVLAMISFIVCPQPNP
jgi:hypothetical protein